MLAAVCLVALIVGAVAKPIGALPSAPPGTKCPAGQSRFTASTPGTVHDVSPAQVWNYIGDFCDPSWQNVQLINTSGTCNHPGNIRYFSALGETLQERLDYNYGSYSNPAPGQTKFGQVFTLVGTYVFQGTTISNVHDLLTVSKSGKHAKINWVVTGCSINPEFSVQVFTAQHGASVKTAENNDYHGSQ